MVVGFDTGDFFKITEGILSEYFLNQIFFHFSSIISLFQLTTQ